MKRPSPFGPARDLLPANQEVTRLSASTTVADALKHMINANFSQLPVEDEGGRIIGIFSYRALGTRVHSSNRIKQVGARPDLASIPVMQCLEPAKFISPDEYIDTTNAADFREDDYVLVGTPDQVLGILTVADVFMRLNDFAEAFFLIQEIEMAIRELITTVLTPEQLNAALNRLQENGRRQNGGGKQLRTLEDCVFSQYRDIISSKDYWDHFAPCFGKPLKNVVTAPLEVVNGLRNDVFHFRRQVERSDTQILRSFRDQLNLAVTNASGH